MINRNMFPSWITQMRISILFPAIVALAGCSQSNETSISPATSLQPVVASSTEPDPEKVERLINDFVEACIIHNDGQPAADPMRPNSTVRYLRERGYRTGFFDPNPPGQLKKIYSEDEDNWCLSSFVGSMDNPLKKMRVRVSELPSNRYLTSEVSDGEKTTFTIDVLNEEMILAESIKTFYVSVYKLNEDTLLTMWTSKL
ncbi:MAG: hypothetical protein AAFU34_17425 [Pseudomonadota bacterium]